MNELRKAAEMVAYEVPLLELLEGVPESARLVIDSEDGMSTRFIPVGHLCKRAAEALRQALAQPEQEPVATVVKRQYEDGTYAGNALDWAGRNSEDDFPVGTKLYTDPQPVKFNCTVVDDDHPNGIPLSQWGRQPEQEPVAWYATDDYGKKFLGWDKHDLLDEGFAWLVPLYTAPPKREWVGLTDEEIYAPWPLATRIDFARWVEAKLKEKNA